jgi:sugar lactone lactonase YvrE
MERRHMLLRCRSPFRAALVLLTTSLAFQALAAPTITEDGARIRNRPADDILRVPGLRLHLLIRATDPAGTAALTGPGAGVQCTSSNPSFPLGAQPFTLPLDTTFPGGAEFIRNLPITPADFPAVVGTYQCTVRNVAGESATVTTHVLDKPAVIPLPTNIAVSDQTSTPIVTFTDPNPVPAHPDLLRRYGLQIYTHINHQAVAIPNGGRPNSVTPSFQIPAGLLSPGTPYFFRVFSIDVDSTEGEPSFRPSENQAVAYFPFSIAGPPLPSLVGDIVTVNAGLVGFVHLINRNVVVADPGVEVPAPSLASNLDATADFGPASLAITMTRRNFATLSHPPGVSYTVTGIDRRVTGVTHTGGNAIIEGLTFTNSGFSFIAKAPEGLFITDVTFSAQFNIATEAALPDVDALQCREPGGGALAQCTFNTPMGVVARNGNVYVADTVSHAVYRIDSATQQKVLVAGLQLDPQDAPDVRYNGDGIDSRQALLNNPTGLALDDAGNLYIADTGNHAIRRVAADASGVIPEGAIITTVAGVPTQFGVDDPLLLFGPRGITVDEEGNLFIADTMNQQIRKRAADGTLSVVAGVAGLPGGNNGPVACTPPCVTPPGRFNKPVGVAVDSSGRVFVADEGNNRIRMVSLDGFVGSTTTANPLRRPTAIVLSPGGASTLLAADYGNHVIRQVAPCDDCSSPTPDVVAGTGEAGSSGASLNSPIGISVDGFSLYIADLQNKRIGKVSLPD